LGCEVGWLPQQFLHRADVGARLQQVRGKTVAQGVHRHRFDDLRRSTGQLNGTLHTFFIEVMAPFNTRSRVNRKPGRWKHPKPAPALAKVRVFHRQRIGHLDGGATALPVM